MFFRIGVMRLKSWDDLPEQMRTPEVRPYYDALAKKRGDLALKRAFDVAASAVLLVLLSPLLVLSAAVALDSPGGVFFRQKRVTSYGKEFRIHKFRTMVQNAAQLGSQVTVDCDPRITRVGAKLRDLRLDELPQLLDILAGNMSFVGTRPEVPRYVARYSPEMWATLLLPAGVTSEASIRYRDEAALLDGAADVDEVYVRDILPGKMKYNLDSVLRFSVWHELGTMVRTVFAVLKKETKTETSR